MTAIKLASLFLLIWFVSLTLVRIHARNRIPAAFFVVIAAASVAFAWSMGWVR